MTYKGREVFTEDTFKYNEARVGDLVDADVVMEAMECLPPACMTLGCAQLGEPYSHREEPDTGKQRATYVTFRCLQGGWNKGVWEYRGHCFKGETEERGKYPVYCRKESSMR